MSPSKSSDPPNKTSAKGHEMAISQSGNAIWRPMVILRPPLTLQAIATRLARFQDMGMEEGGMFKSDRVA